MSEVGAGRVPLRLPLLLQKTPVCYSSQVTARNSSRTATKAGLQTLNSEVMLGGKAAMNTATTERNRGSATVAPHLELFQACLAPAVTQSVSQQLQQPPPHAAR